MTLDSRSGIPAIRSSGRKSSGPATVVLAALLLFLPSLQAGEGATAASRWSSPWKRHVIESAGTGADGVRMADANGDGRPDLVVGWEQSGWSTLHLSQKGPASDPGWATVRVGNAPSVEDALLTDVDGDGWKDVISSTEGRSRKVLVHWAPENQSDYSDSSKWKTEPLFADGSRWMYALAWDVDRNGRPDVVVGGKDEGATVGWLEAPSQPRRIEDWRYHPMASVGWVMSLLVEDMNEDGQPDLLFSDRKGSTAGVRWLENPGAQSPAVRKPWKNHTIGVTGRDVMFIAAADLDGDGSKEVVVPHYKDDDWKLSLLRRRENGDWEEHAVPYPKMAGRSKSAAVGDVDRDGRPDLVLAMGVAHGDLHGIVWLRNTGSPFDGGWETHPISGTVGIKFDLNVLHDLDGDGDLDVLNTEEQVEMPDGHFGLGVVWYENPWNSD